MIGEAPCAELGRAEVSGAEGLEDCEEGHSSSSFASSERDVTERGCLSYEYLWRPLGTGSVAAVTGLHGR